MTSILSNSSATSAEQCSSEVFTPHKNVQPQPISPIGIPTKRSREQVDSISDSDLSNAGKPCSPPLPAPIGSGSLESTSASQRNQQAILKNAVDYLQDRFAHFRVKSQAGNEEDSNAVRRLPKQLIVGGFNEFTTPHQSSSLVELPHIRELFRECPVVTDGRTLLQRRQDNRDLTILTDSSSARKFKAAKKARDRHTEDSRPTKTDTKPIMVRVTEPVTNIVVGGPSRRTVSINSTSQSNHSFINSGDSKKIIYNGSLPVERAIAAVQQRLLQLRKEQSTPQIEQDIQALLLSIDYYNRCKYKVRLLDRKAQEDQRKRQQHAVQWQKPVLQHLSFNASTSILAPMPIQGQSHAQQSQTILILSQRQSLPVQQFSSRQSQVSAATGSLTIQQQLSTATRHTTTQKPEVNASMSWENASSSDDDGQDDDDVTDTTSKQTLTTCDRNGKSGEKKPRWTSDLRNTLFKSIVKHKQLDDMASFHWSQIGAQVGRSGKACKDQWRRAIFPKLLRTFSEEEDEEGELFLTRKDNP